MAHGWRFTENCPPKNLYTKDIHAENLCAEIVQ